MDDTIKNFKVIVPKCLNTPVSFIPSRVDMKT